MRISDLPVEVRLTELPEFKRATRALAIMTTALTKIACECPKNPALVAERALLAANQAVK